MIYLRARTPTAARPRVTPDDAQADALRRKLEALCYTPQNGFHKDRKQDRLGPALPLRRWASQP